MTFLIGCGKSHVPLIAFTYTIIINSPGLCVLNESTINNLVYVLNSAKVTLDLLMLFYFNSWNMFFFLLYLV